MPTNRMNKSNLIEITKDLSSLNGDRKLSIISQLCLQEVESSTRLTSNIWLELSSQMKKVNPLLKDILYPDSVVGTDSHTTMINGLGIVGWGVGGI